MNREQQAARIQKIVNTIAGRAVTVPPEIRPAYIREEGAKVREAFRQTYGADARLAGYAMEFVDAMAGWIEARIHALETVAAGKTEADVGRPELES
ncbi:MAG: hypothetical protein ACJ8BC_09930 [Gemmatimonadales bacterium]